MIERVVPIVVLGGVLLCLAFPLLARFVLPGPVNASTLRDSVVHVSGSASALLDAGDCRRRPTPRVWACSVLDQQGSAAVTYRVLVRPGSSCWDAKLARRDSGVPRDLSGCVRLWRWSLL